MKTMTLIPVLALTVMFNTAYAAENEDGTDDVKEYCGNQAELSGIEDADEKNKYYKDCIDSFMGAVTEQPQEGN